MISIVWSMIGKEWLRMHDFADAHYRVRKKSAKSEGPSMRRSYFGKPGIGYLPS